MIHSGLVVLFFQHQKWDFWDWTVVGDGLWCLVSLAVTLNKVWLKYTNMTRQDPTLKCMVNLRSDAARRLIWRFVGKENHRKPIWPISATWHGHLMGSRSCRRHPSRVRDTSMRTILGTEVYKTSQSVIGSTSGWWFGTWLLWLSICCEESSQLTFIFFRGIETTNQLVQTMHWLLQPTTQRRFVPGSTPWKQGEMSCRPHSASVFDLFPKLFTPNFPVFVPINPHVHWTFTANQWLIYLYLYPHIHE
jgi:hypothetical protein